MKQNNIEPPITIIVKGWHSVKKEKENFDFMITACALEMDMFWINKKHINRQACKQTF